MRAVYNFFVIVIHKFFLETSIYYKNGKYSFSDLKCFQLSGTYLFYVSSNFENVKPIEHKLMVEPTEPETIKILLFNEKQQKDIYPVTIRTNNS